MTRLGFVIAVVLDRLPEVLIIPKEASCSISWVIISKTWVSAS